MATIGVVCVAPDSGGPNKKHRWKFGSRPLLELVARRLTDCQQLERVLVVAGPGFERSRLADAVPSDVMLHFSDRLDTLGQLLSAVEATRAAATVKIDLEHPFIDPVLVDRLVTAGRADAHCDYVGLCLPDGRPMSHSPFGTLAEWCRADALRRAHRLAPSAHARQNVARLMRLHAEKFKMRFIPVPAAFESETLRLAADEHDAWEQAQTIYDWLHPQGPHHRAIAGIWSG